MNRRLYGLQGLDRNGGRTDLVQPIQHGVEFGVRVGGRLGHGGEYIVSGLPDAISGVRFYRLSGLWVDHREPAS